MFIKVVLPIVIFLNVEYLFWVWPRLNGLLGLTLYAAEWGLVSLTVLFLLCHWERKRKKEPAHRPDGAVDVFVTCYTEPFSVIKRTLKAAVAIDYADKKVFLLDDGR